MARVVLKPGAAEKAAQDLGVSLVRKMSKETTTRAKQYAPGGPYSTGTLKNSINWSFTEVGENVRSRVGSDLVYANSVHGGQPARIIVPVRAKHLRFYWRRTGRVETFNWVDHPGTKAQPYLTRAMSMVAPKHGFKTIIYSR